MKDLQLERSRNKEVLPGKKVDYCVTTLLWGGWQRSIRQGTECVLIRCVLIEWLKISFMGELKL